MFRHKQLIVFQVVAILFFAIANVTPLFAAPADPFTGASQAFDAASPEVPNYNAGDWGVAAERGAATYTFPIDAPPGRNGMAPSLALRYSSHSPLRGGLAVGWTLDLPTIERDHSLGADAGVHYKASLQSASGRLVEVEDDLPYEDAVAAYRINQDSSFTRFIRRLDVVGSGPAAQRYFYWTVLTPDGARHHFSKQGDAVADPRWLLVQEQDTFGNTVNYDWSEVRLDDGVEIADYRLDSIEYSGNQAAGLAPHARILFEYAPLDRCAGAKIPIGAAMRVGATGVNGASRLASIKIQVRTTQGGQWRLRRQIDLGYELTTSILYKKGPVVITPGLQSANGAITCKQNLLRYLNQIAVTAYAPDGAATVQPPLTFAYNRRRDTTPELIPIDGNPLQSYSIATPGYAHEGVSGRNRNGARTTLLDVDGDGVRDRVSVERVKDLCHLVWRRGLLGGTFDPTQFSTPLPTVPWYHEWKGQASPLATAKEDCTLSGQIAYRDSLGQTSGAGVLGKGVLSYHFMDYNGDGVLDLITNVWATYCHATYRPIYRLAPFPGSPETCTSPANAVATASPASVLVDDEPPPGEGAAPMTAENQDGRAFESAVIHRHRVRLYQGSNNPDDMFPDLESGFTALALPMLLPPAADDERLDRQFTLQYPIPTLFDIDGDGFLDMISTRDTLLAACANEVLLRECNWTVYFGDGSGNYPETAAAFEWFVPKEILAGVANDPEATCGGVGRYNRHNATIAGLQDFTGDGLPDLIAQTADSQLKVYINTGRAFDDTPLVVGVSAPSDRIQTDCIVGNDDQLLVGARGYLRRLIDLDGDGLLDMIWFADGNTVGNIAAQNHKVWARFNLGDAFGETVELPEVWLAARRLLLAEWNPQGSDVFTGDWHLDADFTDVTGDGLADLVRWEEDQMTLVSGPGLTRAPDLLRSIANGRGLRVRFEYAPSSDASVVQCLDDGCANSKLPFVTWLVKAIEVDPGFDTPVMRTEYAYAQPERQAEANTAQWPERLRFAGYGWTDQRMAGGGEKPTGSVRTHYTYAALKSLPAESWNYRIENGQTHLHQYRRYDYQAKPLFAGQIAVSLPMKTLTCTTGGDGMDQDGCMAQPGHVLRTEEEWTGYAPSTWHDTPETCSPHAPACSPAASAELYVKTAEMQGMGGESAAGDRRSEFAYHIRYGQALGSDECVPTSPTTCAPPPEPIPDDYRILLRQRERFEQTASGEDRLVGRTVTAYGRATGLPLWTQVYQAENMVARTSYMYDAATGNRTGLRKPMQHAGNDGSDATTTFVYDTHQLFVRQTTNELGHVLHMQTDVATGALLQRQGPNRKGAVWEEEQWVIDGFGRTLSHSVSLDDGDGYMLREVERFTYADSSFVDAGQAVSMLAERLRNFGGDVWVRNEQTMDGLGRVLTSSQLLADGRRAVTSYSYDEQGNLIAITTPDPSQDSGATVRYTYNYDGLGRLVRFTRPDHPANGLSITYRGLDKTIHEETADGSGAIRLEVYDVFGHLAALHELYPAAEPAITHYAYDANDNLSRIIDAEGNVTMLAHDWTGNRIAITRGQRTWRYDYDLNGNLLREISPLPAGAAPEAYTVSYTYDDLDRLLTVQYMDQRTSEAPDDSTPAPTATPTPTVTPQPGGQITRSLYLPLVHGDQSNMQSATATGADAQRYLPLIKEAGATVESLVRASQLNIAQEISTIRYVYDENANGAGRLTRVELPFGVISYAYEARGLLAREERAITLDGPVTLQGTQWVERTYNALGQLATSTWDDGQKWRITYDGRGLVNRVDWSDPQIGDWRQVANYERNLAGLPTLRNTSYGQQRTYGYDVLGRPLSDITTVNGATIATRGYTYSDSSDLLSVSGETNGVSAAASYTYDAQHRLLTAAGPNGYSAAFGYSPTGNVHTADVTWNGSFETRNVHYLYGASDPQAVDQLTNPDGSAYASFAYDQAGNMIWRRTTAGDTLLHWNGLDQIRLVETPNGTETYYYDHNGSRMLAVKASDSVRFWFGESETHYDLSGAQTKRYIHLSAGGPTLARVEDGSAIELQYADALQNLMFSLDAAGNLVASFLYGAFGEVVYNEGAEDHRRQFNGKEHDALSGLRYYGYRYYDPLALRWSSADPLFRLAPEIGFQNPQRLNLYTFSLNNPVHYYDPDGLNAKPEEGKPDASCEQAAIEACSETTSEEEDEEKTLEERIKECTSQSCIEEVLQEEVERVCSELGMELCTMLTDSGIQYTAQGEQVLIQLVEKVWSALESKQREWNEVKLNERGQRFQVPDPNSYVITHTWEDVLNELSGPLTSSIGAIFYGTARWVGASHEQAQYVGNFGRLISTRAPRNQAPHNLVQNSWQTQPVPNTLSR